MKSRTNGFLLAYLSLAVVHLVSEQIGNTNLLFLTKPLLMPILAVWFWYTSKDRATRIRLGILWALVFATFGDVFLMLESYQPLSISLFLPGLGSFLVTHLLYIFVFTELRENDWTYLQQHPLPAVLLLLFLGSILFYLWPDLPAGLNVAVVIYSICIILMVLAAINTRPELTKWAYRSLVIGALCFLFSDMVIALNKFKSAQLSIPFIRLIIMSLYILGQGLIVFSLVKRKN